MKKLRKRIFVAVLAALMLTTAMPGTALYASAETETVSDNAIGRAGTDDTEETVDGDTGEPETDDAEETGDSDTEEPAQEPPAGPLEENTGKQEDTGICKHHQEHDADCGYIPKSEDGDGSPCTYECRICPVEDLIADLPDKVTEDNAEEVRAQLDEILALYRELDEDEQGQIDLSRIYALQEALDNANAPMQAAEEINISQNLNNILTEEDGGCPGHTFTGTAAIGARIYVASGTHDVTFSGLTITASAEVGVAPGAATNLTIEGTNTIHAGNNLAGIYVPVGAALVINGTGSLNVSGNSGAGIGGAAYAPDEYSSSGDPNCGTVEINGGTVTATGDSRCAGIGGGVNDFNAGNGGNVTINGGTVTATGGSDGSYGGAGIGGAGGVSNEWYKLVSGSGGTLTINGGNVTLKAGQYGSQYPAYGFGQGSGSAPAGGTCELTLADASYLDSSTTLDPKGKYTINGDPTEDMIVVPTDLVYNGKAQELDGKIYIDDTKEGTGTYFNQTFTVKASADGWTYTINPSEVKAAGGYTVTFSKEGHTSISKTFTVAKSGTQFVGDGEVKTYNGDTQTTTFNADDTITVKAAPTATGAAPQKAAARLRVDPTAGQMALFVGDVQVSEPVGAEADGIYTMTVSAAEVLLKGNAEPNGNVITLTVKFVGNDNMADAAGTVDVNISAAAKTEKNGAVIGYYGESNLNAAFADNGNAGATFTLLSDVEQRTYLDIQIDCTLDLGGHTITSPIGRGLCVRVRPNTAVTIRGEGEIIAKGGIALEVNGSVTLEGGTYTSGGSESASVYVMGQSAMLSVTGEKVAIRNTSGGYGLSVAQAQSVRLSAGTYSGTAEAISSIVKLSDMLAHKDNIRYAYYQGDALVTTGLDGQALTGTVTVKACTHTGEGVCTYTHNGNATTHTKTCLACGQTWAEENCIYGEYTHNDTSHTRICKLCGYQNVEVHNIKCTAEASGTVIAVSEACKTCGYGKDLGTVTIHIPKLVYGDLTGVVTAETTLTEPVTVAGNVKNPLGETTIFSVHAIIDPPTMATLTGDALLSAGEHKIKINIVIIRDENALAECELTFNVDPASLTADMVTLNQTTFTYNGTEQKPAFSVKHGETPLTEGTDYEVSYTRGGAATTDLISVGTITVAVTGKGNYGGTVKKTFTIEKAPLTVTANPQTITYGESIENETERVTVTGLCGSDALTDITLTPSTENVPGGTIMPSAAKIQNGSGDAGANYNITYEAGALTINKAQNPPRMPSAVMGNVSKSCQKVSDVPLPDGWVWQDADKEKALEVGVPVSAVAVYVGADKGNYETLTAPVQITRSDCDHTESEILYTGDGESEPTCTKAGFGHTVCTRCGAVVREYITVPALGHDYDAGEVIKEPTLEDEGERKYTCKRCGHTYTQTIPRKEPQGLWIDHMKPSMDYTGAAVRQEEIEVYYGSTLLREKVDYTISYKNNSKAGTAQIIVTGKGNYTGKATENFEIRPIDIGAQPGMTAIVATAVETGKTLRPAVTVTWNGKKLKEKTDYTLSYSTSIKTAGAYEVTVSGKGNYTGSMVKAFVVKPRGTKLLKSAAVSGIKKSYPYPGSGLAADLQGVVVKMGKTTLVKGTDYTVRTENTDAVGTGTIIIEAAQTDVYAGEKRIAVNITGTDLKKGSIKGVEKSYPYTGRPITPQITVYSGRSGKGEVIPADKYTVSYTNNTEKGKATVTATGIPEKGYSGSVKVTYQIGGLNLAAEKAAGNLKVTMPADISHAKGGAKPQPAITYTYEGITRTLREGADYTLKYSNHTTATGSKPPTVKITGKGNYSGSITETFVIAKQDIGRLSITVTDRAYGKTRKGSYYYSAPKVYDLDGNQLKSGRDYTVQYTYADSGNPIGKNDQIEAGTKLCAVVAAHEKSSYTGTLRATYVVREAKAVKDIGKVKNDKIENQPYTGSAIMPEVRLYTQTGKIKTYLTEEDYEVIGCYNNSRRGTATILVRGKGAYSGVKRVTFKIVQKKIR